MEKKNSCVTNLPKWINIKCVIPKWMDVQHIVDEQGRVWRQVGRLKGEKCCNCFAYGYPCLNCPRPDSKAQRDSCQNCSADGDSCLNCRRIPDWMCFSEFQQIQRRYGYTDVPETFDEFLVLQGTAIKSSMTRPNLST